MLTRSDSLQAGLVNKNDISSLGSFEHLLIYILGRLVIDQAAEYDVGLHDNFLNIVCVEGIWNGILDQSILG